MSVMRRVRDLTAANMHERLSQSEDPVRVIDQFLWSTHQEIVQSEGLQRQYAAHTEHLYRQWKDAEQWKAKREAQAVTALKAGEEDVARLALQEKVMQEAQADNYGRLYEQSKHELAELEQLLQELRSEYRTVYDRRQYYVARMESLRLQQRLNAKFGSGGLDTSRMFRTIEDRMTDIELEAQSLREIRRGGQETAYAVSAVQHTIEQELDSMKRRLQQGGTTNA
ncbi:PspA/IM30 family protein [Cohnella yongneupensis]|uniref:PspA/IM30 family protein n=1 Tax=Cohnella yongneupensis TaxID=425006 RepID=A0ABW0R2K3_9BACL